MCNVVPEDFSIIYNQTDYSAVLNESTAISGAPLIHFTVFAKGSLVSQSFTKMLVTTLSSSTSFFTLDSTRRELIKTFSISNPIPDIFLGSGTVWVAPNKLPPPDVYSLTLLTNTVTNTDGVLVVVQQSTSLTITLLETGE